MVAAIQAEQFSCVYVTHEGGQRKPRREIAAIKQVSLAVPRGEILWPARLQRRWHDDPRQD